MNRPSLQNKLENASVYRELPMDSRGEAFLSELGIVIRHFPPCLKLVEVTSLNVIYRGIGIRNIRGGTEFYCPELLLHPFTVRKPGLTVAPRIEGRRSSTCCLFTDLLDYLSYLTFLDMHGTPIPEGDCIFMSSIRHFIEMVPYCKHLLLSFLSGWPGHV